MPQINNLALALQKSGHSITNPRQKVFDALLHKEPQSMHEIIENLGNTIDRASVYRTVTLFESIGIVHRVYIGWKYKIELTDQFMQHHHHLSCISCGRVIPIKDNDMVDKFISTTSKLYDFQPTQHQFEITGYCKNCKPI